MGSNQSTAELVEVHFNDALYIVEMPKEKFKCKDVVNEISLPLIKDSKNNIGWALKKRRKKTLHSYFLDIRLLMPVFHPIKRKLSKLPNSQFTML